MPKTCLTLEQQKEIKACCDAYDYILGLRKCNLILCAFIEAPVKLDPEGENVSIWTPAIGGC
jgi:hypothetical protein